MEEQFLYDIKNAARHLGIATSTLRYWESQGLVQAERNAANDYRQYSLHDLIVASEIAFYRRLGVPIKDLKRYKELSPRELDEALARTERDIEQRMRDLSAMQSRLAKQRSLNAQAKRLADLGMHEGTPSIRVLRPIDYRSSSSWQLLVEEPWRYSVVIDADKPDTVLEAIADEGEKPRRPAEKARAQSSPAAKHGPDQAIQSSGSLDRASSDRDALWVMPEGEGETAYLECLLEVGSSLETSNAEALLDEARERGFSPTTVVGTYLLTATDSRGRWDYHRAWIVAPAS